MKPKSLQTSVSKRGARAEFFLVSLLVLWSFLAKASQDSETLSNTGTVFEPV